MTVDIRADYETTRMTDYMHVLMYGHTSIHNKQYIANKYTRILPSFVCTALELHSVTHQITIKTHIKPQIKPHMALVSQAMGLDPNQRYSVTFSNLTPWEVRVQVCACGSACASVCVSGIRSVWKRPC